MSCISAACGIRTLLCHVSHEIDHKPCWLYLKRHRDAVDIQKTDYATSDIYVCAYDCTTAAAAATCQYCLLALSAPHNTTVHAPIQHAISAVLPLQHTTTLCASITHNAYSAAYATTATATATTTQNQQLQYSHCHCFMLQWGAASAAAVTAVSVGSNSGAVTAAATH
eukprot:10118-Heterococcus_DN1.PRE.2